MNQNQESAKSNDKTNENHQNQPSVQAKASPNPGQALQHAPDADATTKREEVSPLDSDLSTSRDLKVNSYSIPSGSATVTSGSPLQNEMNENVVKTNDQDKIDDDCQHSLSADESNVAAQSVGTVSAFNILSQKQPTSTSEEGVHLNDIHHQEDQLFQSKAQKETTKNTTAAITTSRKKLTRPVQKPPQQLQQNDAASGDETNQNISIGNNSSKQYTKKCVNDISQRPQRKGRRFVEAKKKEISKSKENSGNEDNDTKYQTTNSFDFFAEGIARDQGIAPRQLKKEKCVDDSSQLEVKRLISRQLKKDLNDKDVETTVEVVSMLNVRNHNENEDGVDQTAAEFDSFVEDIEPEQGIVSHSQNIENIQQTDICNFDSSSSLDNEMRPPGAVHVEGLDRDVEDPSDSSMLLVSRMSSSGEALDVVHSEPCIIAHLVTEPNDIEEQNLQSVVATRVSGLYVKPKKAFALIFLTSFAIAIYVILDKVLSGETSPFMSKYTPTSSPTTTLPSAISPDNETTTTMSPPAVLPDTKPVLETVKGRGFIRCSGNLQSNPYVDTFALDLCHAIAAAVFDDPQGVANRTELSAIKFSEQFTALWNRTIDVSTLYTTHTMERDVYEPSTGQSMAFTTPFLYSGMKFAGRPTFVDCADRLDTLFGDCGKLSVCVHKGTTSSYLVDKLLPGTEKHEEDSSTILLESFANGKCNAVAAGSLFFGQIPPPALAYLGEIVVSEKLHSNEPLAITTKGDDQEWADFCDWIVRALIKAEDLNITQEIALSSSLWSNVTASLNNEVFETFVFGTDHKNMFRNVIAAVGNYGEIYERHFESRIPRGIRGVNTINAGDSGLLYSFPFGNLVLEKRLSDASSPSNIPPPGPTAGGTLESIVDLGFLRCGVIGNQPGFSIVQHDESTAEQPMETNLQNKSIWSGLDIAYCRAIAGAIFQDEVSNVDDGVVYVEVGTVEEDGYVALDEDRIDVFVGGSYSLMADVKETNTGRGFTFTPPYFYYDYGLDTNSNIGIGIDARWDIGRLVVTNDADPQWSAFVRWTTFAMVYAEQEGITQEHALEMPVVELFGSDFLQMFRYMILVIGNYGEVFNRELKRPYNVTRAGRNRINIDGTPQHLPVPFL